MLTVRLSDSSAIKFGLSFVVLKKIHEVKVKRRYIWKVLGFLPT